MELRTLLQHSAPGLQEFLQGGPVGGRPPAGPRALKWQRLAETYILGLLLPGERKSMRPIASRTDAEYEALQQFITDSPWDSEATLDGIIAQIAPQVSGPEGVIVLDDTSNPKKGKHSPGVAKQYSGLRGDVDNCQVAVSGLYALHLGPSNADVITWPLGMRLYLPGEWAGDPVRRKRAGIPDEVEFKEKGRLALELVDKARRHRIPHRAVLADIAYGHNGGFRAQLQAWNEPYVVGVKTGQLRVVPADTPIHPPGTWARRGRPRTRPWLPGHVRPRSPRELARRLPRSEWKTVQWGEGAKGTLEGEFARAKVRVCHGFRKPTEEVGWLLLEKRSGDLKAYLCGGLDNLTLAEMAGLAHLRWPVERGYQDMKSELGWDHFEGRTWNGFHHHAVLTQIAYAYLSWWRWKHRESPGVPMPTLPEVRRGVVNHVVERLLEEARRDLGGRLPLGLQLLAEMVRKGG